MTMYYGVASGINTFVSAVASKPVGKPNGKEQIWLFYIIVIVVYFYTLYREQSFCQLCR
jgi:hypothetical protein